MISCVKLCRPDQLCDTADCRRSAECGAGGRWSLGSTLPRCQAVECSAPAPPRHGSVHAVRPGTTVRKYFSHDRQLFLPKCGGRCSVWGTS